MLKVYLALKRKFTRLHSTFSKGFSLVEVMVAIVILLVAFLGMIALSASLLNSNAQATNLNIATEIASMQVAQLDCLGVTGVASFSNPYTYYIAPSVIPDSSSDKRIGSPNIPGVASTACINPVLTYGGVVPSNLSTNGGLAITIPYTVAISFSTNPNNLSEADAVVRVSWNNGLNSVTFYDTLSSFM